MLIRMINGTLTHNDQVNVQVTDHDVTFTGRELTEKVNSISVEFEGYTRYGVEVDRSR